jgi:molybdopterin/thiamine biosynthesis adenylyltransferase
MQNDRWSRLEGVLDRDALRGKNVLVVGLGSGGSTVALELAKAGVGGFVLVDPDHVEESNLIRHECDDRYYGWNKAEAVAELIGHRNPEARVGVIPMDAFKMGHRLEDLAKEADLVAVCTDAEQPKHLLNRLCTTFGTPAVYAGVFERGTGGEVIHCAGGPKDPCYACVTSVLKESAPSAPEEELDYGTIGPDGAIHGAPGLGLDVRLIALLHAKVCLLTLTGQELPGNVVLFGTAPVEGLFPRAFASAVLAVVRQDACLVCRPIKEIAKTHV